MKIVIRDDEKKDKAVSAIIGTILIVAITVVLAATLYAVLGGFSGLIRPPTPSMSVSVSSVGGGTGTAGGSYSISITSLSANVAISDLSFTLTESSGTSVTVTGLTNASGTASATDHGFTISITPLGGTSSAPAIELQSIITISLSNSATPIALSSFSVTDTATSGSLLTNTPL
jgi:flagellin-like protein